jgi:nicotinate-nucleotide pyrophosphorylase (carboxylating)
MKELQALVREALAEDIGQGDITTNATIAPDAICQAWLLAKQDGILSGMKVFRMVFDLLEADIRSWEALTDGMAFKKGDRLATFQGLTRAILTGERVGLNFIQHLSGVATMASRFVKLVEGHNVRLCDTRKTMPLMRKLEKDAVVHGGASNHRYALFDGVLIKENHVTGAGGVHDAVRKARNGTHHLMRIGVEVRDLNELNEAIDADADAILLDNMSLDDMRKAVEIVGNRKILLEASGNVTLERVREVAATGVPLISVGALTHSAPAVDLSLVIRNA